MGISEPRGLSLGAMETQADGTVLELPIPSPQLTTTCWFWRHGCVVDSEAGRRRVYIGGALIGEFDPDDRDRGPRNVLLVTLAKEPTMHFGRLANAFGIGEEYLRRLRRLEEAEGLSAVLLPAAGYTKRGLDETKRKDLRRLFKAGWNATEATRRQRRGKRVSRATVSRERRRWSAEQRGEQLAAPVEAAIAQVRVREEHLALSASVLPDAVGEPTVGDHATAVDSDAAPPTAEVTVALVDRPILVETAVVASTTQARRDEVAAAVDEDDGGRIALGSRPVVGGESVQHVGTWMMMALAARDGLHDEVAALDDAEATRIAVDATLASLAIGERTVEGVRRIATPTAPTLLRADRPPAASTIRGRLCQFAKAHGAAMSAAMSQRYVAAARGGDGDAAVFYIDNHMRPYTGEEVIRKSCRHRQSWVPVPPGSPGTRDPPGGAETVLRLVGGATRHTRARRRGCAMRSGPGMTPRRGRPRVRSCASAGGTLSHRRGSARRVR